jgi:hypothetical protein
VLVAIFTKMDRQFTVDQTVSGTVTLRLVSVPFDLALNEICRQAHLIWRYNGAVRIYNITWEPAALKGGYALTQYLVTNGLASAQDASNMMGLLPSNANSIQDIQITSLPETYLHDFDSVSALAQRVPNSKVMSGVVVQQPAGAKSVVVGHIDPNATQFRASGDSYSVAMAGRGGFGGAAGPAGMAIAPPSQSKADSSEPDSRVALRVRAAVRPMPVGNLVYFQIPSEQRMQASVLVHQLGIEAGIPVIADGSVPPTCVVSGRLSARSLAKALDALAIAAHLTWVWTGDRVVVSAMPVAPTPATTPTATQLNASPTTSSQTPPKHPN